MICFLKVYLTFFIEIQNSFINEIEQDVNFT